MALTELWRCYGVTRCGDRAFDGRGDRGGGGRGAEPGRGAVIATRSRLMSRLAGQGAMALLELDPGATEVLIADYPDVTLAVPRRARP